MNGEDKIRLGHEAERILDSDVFKKAMDELDTGLIEMWASGFFKTQEEREDAFNRVRGARMFKDRLSSFVSGMKIQKASDALANKRQASLQRSGHEDE